MTSMGEVKALVNKLESIGRAASLETHIDADGREQFDSLLIPGWRPITNMIRAAEVMRELVPFEVESSEACPYCDGSLQGLGCTDAQRRQRVFCMDCGAQYNLGQWHTKKAWEKAINEDV